MMRVLHITRDYPPRHCGGISTAVGGLVGALARSGIVCAVASFDDYRPTGTGRPAWRRDPSPAAVRKRTEDVLRIDDADDLQALARFARDFAPSLIQLHVDLLWEFAAELRDRLGVPLVSTLHVCHRQMLRVLAAEKASASLAAQERALEHADLLVAPTRAAADTILGDYPEVAGRLRVAGYTVGSAPPANPAEPRLVSVGRFGAAKGTDRLIALLPYLLAEPRLTIDVVGGLPRNARRDRRWRRRIDHAAGAHRERVRVHGWLEPTGRDAVLSTARALLSTSRIETFGLVALEALARGVPVCGYSEPALVETAPQQLWLDDAEPPRIADAVVELIGDPPRCMEMGRAGRQAVPLWPTVVDRWRAVYSAASHRLR